MKNFGRLLCGSMLVLCLTVVSPGVLADDDDYDDDYRYRGTPGAYTAHLDLRPLGIDRIEAFGVVLERDGAALFVSEHESDRETTGVGVWQRLRGRRIGVGVLTFRFGEESACFLVGVMSPPDNCVQKLGATLRRTKDGSFKGELFITVEGPDAEFVIPVPLPFSMKPLRLKDFPGALP